MSFSRRPFAFRVRHPAVFAVALTTLLRVGPAFAGDEAAAEALFLEAKALAGQGKYGEACPKFAESNRLDRGAGTLIHLGDCYEKSHRTASAWATFKDAASAAQALGRADWQKLAAQRAAALEPKLARLTLRVIDPAPKIEVTRDGVRTSEASWNTAIPVDVGTYAIAVSAPSRQAFATSVTVTKDGDRIEIVVPRLKEQTAAATPRPSARPDDAPGSGRRTLGLVIGGVGIAGAATGAVLGLVAIGKNTESKRECPSDGPCANPDAVDANESAKSYGLASTIAFIVGGVGLGAGTLLYLTAPSGDPSRSARTNVQRHVRIVPSVHDRSTSVSVVGVF